MEKTTARFPHLMAQPRRESISHLIAAPENLEMKLAYIGNLKAERERLAVEAEHLGKARAKLAGEVQDFERKRDDLTRAHAERLAAGKASTLPAELATIPAEIEARNLALASIQKNQGVIGERIKLIEGDIEASQTSARKFRAWILEAEYLDALAAIRPGLAKWFAAARMAGHPTKPITLDPLEHEIQEARKELLATIAEY